MDYCPWTQSMPSVSSMLRRDWLKLVGGVITCGIWPVVACRLEDGIIYIKPRWGGGGETKESILATVLGNSIRNLLSRTVDCSHWSMTLLFMTSQHCITRDVNGAEFYKFEWIHFKIHSISGTRKIFNYYYCYRHKAEMHEMLTKPGKMHSVICIWTIGKQVKTRRNLAHWGSWDTVNYSH